MCVSERKSEGKKEEGKERASDDVCWGGRVGRGKEVERMRMHKYINI